MFVVLLRGSGSQVAGAVEQVCCRLHPPGSRGVARKMYAIVSVDKKKKRGKPHLWMVISVCFTWMWVSLVFCSEDPILLKCLGKESTSFAVRVET
jgi:hypothetical protein